jgi:hypothetical protein
LLLQRDSKQFAQLGRNPRWVVRKGGLRLEWLEVNTYVRGELQSEVSALERLTKLPSKMK